MPDVLERRILGAFRMVSAITATSIDSDFALDAGELDVLRNRSGIYVVRDAPGMHELTLKSEVPGVTIPAQQQFELTVRDDSRVYLPRRFKLKLPRKIAPASDQDSVMNAVQVQLYPTSAAPTAQSWALLRVSVIKAGGASPIGLPWSLLEVKQKSDGTFIDDRHHGRARRGADRRGRPAGTRGQWGRRHLAVVRCGSGRYRVR